MSERSDKITLYERESDGQRTAKVGEHEDRLLQQGHDLTTDKAVTVIELDEAITHEEMLEMDRDDLPDTFGDFFDGKEVA
jgi:hypothetical protein